MGRPRCLLPLLPSPPSHSVKKEDPWQEDFYGETGKEQGEKRCKEGEKPEQGQE